MTHPLHQLLENDMNEIKPDVVLEKRISHQFAPKKIRHSHPWRLPVLSGVITTAVLAVMVLTNGAQNGQPSLIAQAEAAYADLQAKLSEPGAVRHTITQVTGSDNFPLAELESWTTADESSLLSGPLGSPSYLTVNGAQYHLSTEAQDALENCTVQGEETICTGVGTGPGTAVFMVDEKAVAHEEGTLVFDAGIVDETTPEDPDPQYIMLPPDSGGSITQWFDPADPSVICVDWVGLTPEQQAAKQTMGEINRVSEAVKNGTGGAEDLLAILKNSSNVEDRGVVTDTELGKIHLYRLSYNPILSSAIPPNDDPLVVKSFSEFGISIDSSMLVLTREGAIEASGKETTDMTLRILVDEVLSADEVDENLFSAERLGFEKIPPPPADHPDVLPHFELKTGCYRKNPDAPQWLNTEDEAAARARIAADPNAGSMGGGGF